MTNAIVNRYAGRKGDTLLQFLLLFKNFTSLFEQQTVSVLASLPDRCTGDAFFQDLFQNLYEDKKKLTPI